MSSGKSRRLQRAKQAAKRRREAKSGGKAAAPGTSTGHGGNPYRDARGRFARGPSSGQAASPPPQAAETVGPKKDQAPKRKAPRKGAKARLAGAKARVGAKEAGRPASRSPALEVQAAALRAKYGGRGRMTTAEAAKAAAAELNIIRMVGGRHTGIIDGINEPADGEVNLGPGPRNLHFLEAKAKVVSNSRGEISVKNDALYRKALKHAETPESAGFHTIVHDLRDGADQMYYFRGVGRRSIGNMHPFKGKRELKRLMLAPVDSLPEKARGTTPEPTLELKAKADRAHAARRKRDMRRNQEETAARRAAKESVDQ